MPDGASKDVVQDEPKTVLGGNEIVQNPSQLKGREQSDKWRGMYEYVKGTADESFLLLKHYDRILILWRTGGGVAVR